jgi:hypothetical protein
LSAGGGIRREEGQQQTDQKCGDQSATSD